MNLFPTFFTLCFSYPTSIKHQDHQCKSRGMGQEEQALFTSNMIIWQNLSLMGKSGKMVPFMQLKEGAAPNGHVWGYCFLILRNGTMLLYTCNSWTQVGTQGKVQLPNSNDLSVCHVPDTTLRTLHTFSH